MIDKEILEAFLADFDNIIEDSNEIIDLIQKGKKVPLHDLFRSFHTLKGNASILEFGKMHLLAKAYCEFLRPKQKEDHLTKKEIQLFKECFVLLQDMRNGILAGKSDESYSIKKLIKKIELLS